MGTRGWRQCVCIVTAGRACFPYQLTDTLFSEWHGTGVGRRFFEREVRVLTPRVWRSCVVCHYSWSGEVVAGNLPTVDFPVGLWRCAGSSLSHSPKLLDVVAEK